MPLVLARLDFGWITTLHILYPPLTIGLAGMLFLAEATWLRTDDERWYRLCRFFERLFIINFAAGVATGITMEMAFGILYGPFSQATGPFFGQVLGYETITAFMYEAGFIGLMIFGWGKISRRMHLFATFNVALSSAISAMWILDANSWMQTPSGVTLEHGVFYVSDWFKALFNPDWIYSFPHMLVASYELAICVVASISAWYVLQGLNTALFLRALKWSVLALVVVAPLQVYLGDATGLTVADDQPAVLAAMEGHWNTYNKDGSVNNGWHILAWPNAKGDGNAWAVTLPHVLSLLETHSWDGKVQGLNDFKPEDRPDIIVPFYGFRIMVAVGMSLMLLALWGGWLVWRGRFTSEAIGRQRWFLRAAVASAVLPYVSVWVGWWTREIGRQPWVVYGMMRTTDGVSHMSVGQAVFWLVGYMGFELMVWGATWWFLSKLIKQGPDLTTPVVGEGDANLGDLPNERQERQGTKETPKATEPAQPGRLRPA